MFRNVRPGPRLASLLLTLWSLSYIAWPFYATHHGYHVGQTLAGAAGLSLVGLVLGSALPRWTLLRTTP